MIYLDNASTTKISEHVLEEMIPILGKTYGNPSSLHTLGQRAKEILESAREKIAKCINANPNEIYFTSGGTESDNQAIVSACTMGARQGKNQIITTKFEHHAVLHTIEQMKSKGFDVVYLDVYEDGVVKIEDLLNAITDKTCLVSIMLANNEIGTIQPIKEIGAICKEKGIIFHTDAVAGIGHIKIDVKDMNIDFMAVSGHKFNAPKGVGFLYARRGIIPTNLLFGGAQEKLRRPGTENIASIYGMAVALEDVVKNLDNVNKKSVKLRDYLIDELSKIPHSSLNGSKTQRVANNVNFCFEGIEGESLILLLDDAGICASSGSACTSGSLDPSHVLLAIGRPHEVAHGSLRLTFGEDFTQENAKTVVSKIKEIVEYLRSISPVWDELEKGERKHVI